MRQVKRGLTISASEVGDFVYCAKAWHLKRHGQTPQSELLGEGIAFHKQQAASISQAEHLNRAGRLIAITAVSLLLLLLVVALVWYASGGAK